MVPSFGWHLDRVLLLILPGALSVIFLFDVAHRTVSKLGGPKLIVSASYIWIVLIEHAHLVAHWDVASAAINGILVCRMIQRVLFEFSLRSLQKSRRLLILLRIALHPIAIVHHRLSERILLLRIIREVILHRVVILGVLLIL